MFSMQFFPLRGNYAEIFVDDRFSIDMVGGYIENSVSVRDFVVGIRIFDGLNSVYAYINNSKEDNLIEVVKEAALAIKPSKKDIVLNLTDSHVPYRIELNLPEMDIEPLTNLQYLPLLQA